MRFLTLVLCAFVFAGTAQASKLDGELRKYITAFGLKPLPKLENKKSAVFRLGEQLFVENEISGNRDINCSTCHDPKTSTAEPLPFSIGTGGVGIGLERKQVGNSGLTPRNAPAIFNLGDPRVFRMFWDSRVMFDVFDDEYKTPEPTLVYGEELGEKVFSVIEHALDLQALFPPTSHVEMRGQKGENELADAETNPEVWRLIMKRLLKMKKYQKLFKEAFPQADEFHIGHFAHALGHYQAHEFSVIDTGWDRYIGGQVQALDNRSKRGALVFMTVGNCMTCHRGDLLGGNQMRAIAMPQTGEGKGVRRNDEGLFGVSKRARDRYKFRTPMLRNVALTAPYGHSGAYATLEDMVEHYRGGIKSIDRYDGRWLQNFVGRNYKSQIFVETDHYKNFRKKENAHPSLRAFSFILSNQEKSDLVHFLKYGLTGQKYLKLVK